MNTPAFPIVAERGEQLENSAGMTLRDYFAAHAPVMPPKMRELQKIAECAELKNQSDFGIAAKYEAWWRWAYADAMLAERAK